MMEDWNVDLERNSLFYDHLYSLFQDEFCHSNTKSFCQNPSPQYHRQVSNQYKGLAPTALEYPLFT